MFKLFQDNNVVKRGNFTLKSGKKSLYYINLRELYSNPYDMNELADLATKHLIPIVSYTRITLCPVPVGAIVSASFISSRTNTPLIIPKFERKEYGLKTSIDGNIFPSDRIIVFEDVITSGKSIRDICDIVEENCDNEVNIFVIFDRQNKKIPGIPKYECLYTKTEYLRDRLEFSSIDRPKFLIFQDIEQLHKYKKKISLLYLRDIGDICFELYDKIKNISIEEDFLIVLDFSNF